MKRILTISCFVAVLAGMAFGRDLLRERAHRWMNSGGGELWTPAELDTRAWYDASDTNTIAASSGLVSQWNDKSTNSYHLAQADDAKKPRTGTRTKNSLNVLDFDGTNVLVSSAFNIATNGDVNIFIVAELDVVDAINDSLVSMNGANSFQFSAENPPAFNGNLKVTGIGSSVLLGGDKGPSIYNLEFDFTDTGKYFAYLNGTRSATDSAYSTKLQPAQPLILFANRNQASMIDGYIAEVVILDNCASECRVLTEGYLAHKWGLQANLPPGHKYKNKPPYK